MKGNNGVKFFLVIAIIAILTWIAAAGPTIGGFKIKGLWDMNTGVDIRGGVTATLSAPEGLTPTADEMSAQKSKIRKRLDGKGIFDATITPEINNTRLAIEIPWAQGEKDFDAQKLIEDTIKTALLTFRYVDETKKNEDGTYQPVGEIILQGTDVTKAGVDPQTNDVTLELSAEGGKKFGEATTKLAATQGIIGIFMDDTQISAPGVRNGPIIGRNAVIQGQGNATEAGELAGLINAGALPFKLEVLSVDSISPTLGTAAYDISMISMGVAIILVWVFMLLYYRLMGLLANVALLAHTVIQLLFLSWLGITVTLPGIAGIILTIGMGVDANIIIFERIKEELRNGKTLRAAIDVGFKRAFTAVLDANMTTLIAAAVLYYFGSGAIQSFAVTLGLGVALSFLTAVVVSRIMLKSVSDLNIAKHPWLYGVKLKAKETREVKA
jgi:preprotein translocase subunit SecD